MVLWGNLPLLLLFAVGGFLYWDPVCSIRDAEILERDLSLVLHDLRVLEANRLAAMASLRPLPTPCFADSLLLRGLVLLGVGAGFLGVVILSGQLGFHISDFFTGGSPPPAGGGGPGAPQAPWRSTGNRSQTPSFGSSFGSSSGTTSRLSGSSGFSSSPGTSFGRSGGSSSVSGISSGGVSRVPSVISLASTGSRYTVHSGSTYLSGSRFIRVAPLEPPMSLYGPDYYPHIRDYGYETFGGPTPYGRSPLFYRVSYPHLLPSISAGLYAHRFNYCEMFYSRVFDHRLFQKLVFDFPNEGLRLLAQFGQAVSPVDGILVDSLNGGALQAAALEVLTCCCATGRLPSHTGWAIVHKCFGSAGTTLLREVVSAIFFDFDYFSRKGFFLSLVSSSI